MANQVYSVKVDGRVVAKFRADLAQASATVEVSGEDGWVPTRHQTASGRHSEARTAALILSDDPDTREGDSFTVVCESTVVGVGRIGNGWYEFRAHNSQTQRGYGMDHEATAYAAHLNEGREVNHYSPVYLAADDVTASEIAGLDVTVDGFNLAEDLADAG